MNILYIAHFTEGSGWSHSAINHVLALESVGVNVICRNFQLTNNLYKVDDKISECMNKPIKDIDICIQHVLPHHFVGTDIFKKNIIYYDAGEINTIRHISWFQSISMADEIWVPCKEAHDNLLADGLMNVHVVPHCFNLLKYNKDILEKINVGIQNNFKFYTIANLNDRKNIDSIIRCFHSEFKTYEPVELILKLNHNTVPENTVQQIVREKINNIKSSLRIYNDINKYKMEYIITSYLSNEDILNLHNSCDCFILPSHGEGFSLPSFEAMCLGKTPICSNCGGPKDFIDKDNINTGYLVDGVRDICVNNSSAFEEINTGLEEWFHPSESIIKKAMRYYYENSHNINRLDGKERASDYSLEKIGTLMMEKIDE